jgi:hypothetical protein
MMFSSATDLLAQRSLKPAPLNGGPVPPARSSPWHAEQRTRYNSAPSGLADGAAQPSWAAAKPRKPVIDATVPRETLFCAIIRSLPTFAS